MSNSNLAQSGWTTTLALAGAALVTLGIISGYSGSKARDVLVDESYLENIF